MSARIHYFRFSVEVPSYFVLTCHHHHLNRKNCHISLLLTPIGTLGLCSFPSGIHDIISPILFSSVCFDVLCVCIL
jgi:hypothetical protein